MVARTVAWAVVLCSTVALGCSVWIETLPRSERLEDFTNFVWIVGTVGVEWVIAGAALIHLRPHNVLGWLFLGAGALNVLQVILAAYGGYGVMAAQPAWPGAAWAAAASTGLWIPSALLTPTIVVALYPNGRLPSRWWRWPVIGAAVAVSLPVLVMPFDPTAYEDIAPGHAPPAVLPSWVPTLMLWGGFVPLLGASIVAIWAGTIVRLARSEPPERQQLAWFVCAAGPLLTFTYVDVLPQQVVALCAALIPVVVAVGVLRYRMLGIEIVLRRGLVYGALTAAVIALYLGVTVLVGSALDERPLPGVLAAALVAVSLTPARDRLQRLADRLVYGARRDPLRAIAQLGDQVAVAGEPDLLPTALQAVSAAVRAPAASVTGPDGRCIGCTGELPTSGPTFPLQVGGRFVGELQVADRAPADAYGETETRLLGALAPQVAVLVRALELTEALETERNRVIGATRAERDRIRHDLHDGLGPSLSGMGLGLQAAVDTLRVGDQATCATLLTRIGDEVVIAVQEIRRIIDGLRPIALDAMSLSEAIRRHAEAVSGSLAVEVTVGEPAELHPEVETAAYRIVTEAITNTVRHAAARHCHVVLSARDGVLHITVTDDGTGMPAGTTVGIGLSSMRRRAEALTGTLTIESTASGTVLTATLPLKAP
ncbi:sensor histidine kinase [Streptomyces neyagawaensis]|uniref:sensor histidine kinase n=1 Tax=Streptomyces neyagawaensis TaxID=42238 RepID=UPI00147015C6|nr:sensor histidine kinase [Streptomyces neyagawaensis]MCL6732521.1 sensor histidine kinase [Streptomyces neyagawaensis]MDE1687160.1 sensor histidine kinase [Streptomyces neyagawaensis]